VRGGFAALTVAAAAALLGHPIVGFVIAMIVILVALAVTVPSNSVLAWRIGAKGEISTANALTRLPGGFVVLHDRKIPGTRANIDHIVIGPPGVAIVESKSYSGTLKVESHHRRSET
jgi:hypothetical protein